MRDIESFIVAPFKGVLCLFLLDIGLVAGRNLLQSRHLITRGLVAFGFLMPVLASVIGLGVALLLNLPFHSISLSEFRCTLPQPMLFTPDQE